MAEPMTPPEPTDPEALVAAMTIREAFAGLVMLGLLIGVPEQTAEEPEQAARDAVYYANLLVAALNERRGGGDGADTA